MWMKFIAKSTIIIGNHLKFRRKVSCQQGCYRVNPYWCEPLDEVKGERERKEVFLMGTAPGSWWRFGTNSFTVGLAVKFWNKLKTAPQCQVDYSPKIITGLFKSNHGRCRYIQIFFIPQRVSALKTPSVLGQKTLPLWQQKGLHFWLS